MLTKLNAGWLLVISIVIWAVALPLFQDGMFVDGLLYATVSRNLALGYGTFWDPYVSQSVMQQFHEQPPLGFWLQSFFFRLDTLSIYPERVYSFCFLLLAILAIRKFWKETSGQFAYWPILLFLSIPTIRWGFVNNVLENTMLFFDLLAVYFFFLAMKKEKGIWYLLAGIGFTFLASFSKGIQGLFPVIVPIIYSITFQQSVSNKKAWRYFLFAVIGITLIYTAILLSYEARESYRMYFEQRFQDFPRTKHANTATRFKILYYLVIELAIPILLCGIVLFLSRINRFPMGKIGFVKNENSLFFLMVGISASFPLMITFEQRGFYTNTSMPYFAMALAGISLPWLVSLQSKLASALKRNDILNALILLSCIVGLIATIHFAGSPKRDAMKIHDTRIIGNSIGVGGKVCTVNEWDDWSMRYYFSRYYQISVYGSSMDCTMILAKQADISKIPAEYYKSDFSTQYYQVYQK